MAQVQRQIETPPPHRPPLLPHTPIQPTRRLERMQQIRGALRSGAPLALQQTVAMAVRHSNTVTSQLQRRRRTVIALPRRMTRVFNATPIYPSEETGPSRVISKQLPQLAVPRTLRIPLTRWDRSSVIALSRRMTRVFNATPIYASKEIGQSQVTLTRELTQLALPRTPHIPLPRWDMGSVIALSRRMTRVFNATPIYSSKEIGQSLVILTRELPQLAVPRTPHIPPTPWDRSSLL